MSLDQNLFTLIVTPSKQDPNVVDLVDPNGIIYYRKQRLIMPGGQYSIQVYDFMSESLLITVTAPSSTSKTKVLELCNPSAIVELKYTGTLTFRWAFKWEEHEFEWKREECYLLRKPDPSVLVALTKEPPGKLKTTCVQILDYNLNRFDIDDRKGLEIVILTALLTFQDANETYHTTSGSQPSLDTRPRAESTPPPPLPAKPAAKTGVDRIAEIQAIRGEINEVNVVEEGVVDDYAQYVENLLQDEAMLFVTVRSEAADQVPKVLQVVEETKRRRHKAGLGDDELFQYVVYDTIQPKGPRIINLDSDQSKNKYTPPNSLIIHLSKISMPELQPQIAPSTSPGPSTITNSATPPFGKDSKSKNATKSRSRSSSPRHIYSNQIHPNQPSPSPSQLNNPGIYVAPPPPSRSSFYGSKAEGFFDRFHSTIVRK